MPISALPTPPSRSDSVNFATRADAWNAAMVLQRTEYNALEVANLTQGTEATAAKNAAIAAWAASTAPAENLPALSTAIHSGAIVKAIIYDTSKDSDGGAWRKRTSHTSWYNETLGGTIWLGRAATAAAGWALSGAVTGAYFQNSTDGKFYTLGASSPSVTECFRGNVREFPQQVAIVAESARVVLYDLTQIGCPMWMVLRGDISGYLLRWASGAASITTIAATNGRLVVGGSNSVLLDFIADNYMALWSSQYSIGAGNILLRNTALGAVNGGKNGYVIVNATVNDVAITVLDSAPIDPATGLPTPTIAVATGGGVSVIKDDGTVVNSSQIEPTGGCAIGGTYLYLTNRAGVSAPSRYVNLVGISASWTPASVIATLLSGGAWDENSYILATKGAKVVTRSSALMSIYQHNLATSANSLRAQITNAYNSGWMPGDIRGAYLADTVAETITASGELVTNGTFTTDTSGWTAQNGATLSATGAELTVTNSGATYGAAYQTAATVVGKTYTASCTARCGTASPVTLGVGTGAGGTSLGVANTTSGTNVQLSATFVATGTATFISLINDLDSGGTGIFDSISVKLAEPDRSVKNNGLVVNGSLTKTAVASGAGLVAYSGFSASNYLEQPYNTNLDFGTGDFCVMGWVNPSSLTGTILHRAIAAFTGGILITLNAAGSLDIYGTASTTYTLLMTSTSGAIAINTQSHIVVMRLSGTVYVYVNGNASGSVANSTNFSYTSAVTRIGLRNDATVPLVGSMALWRISATAPTADQIAHIYRTELPLFQANAQCTIAGTSTAVTALAYDEVADELHVGTSWGRSEFRDLVRVASEATTTGAITTLSANQGAVLTGGTSGKYYQPAMLLRDELRRREEARQALGRVVVGLNFTATASQTAFVCTKGYDVRFVYSNGLLKRLTADYTVSDDGFQKTVTFTQGQLVSVPVTIMLTRS